MDKKNIMALSIIAIAVLLVAVISGSFAYFSAVGTNNANTTVTGSLPTIGTVATSGGVTLSMNLTLANMQSSAQGTYYAQTGGAAPVLNTAKNHTIATMAVTGGSTGLTYNCSGKVTISLPTDASANTIKDVITAGSLFVKLTQGTGVKLTDSGTEIDLFGAKTTNIEKTFTYVLNDTTKSTNITGDVYFKNTNASQNTLNGKTIKVTINAVTTSCTVA